MSTAIESRGKSNKGERALSLTPPDLRARGRANLRSEVLGAQQSFLAVEEARAVERRPEDSLMHDPDVRILVWEWILE